LIFTGNGAGKDQYDRDCYQQGGERGKNSL
jgi:hypothetical protein